MYKPGTPGEFDVSASQKTSADLHPFMDEKKRKKFGLSLKNSKKLAVTKSIVKEQGSPSCVKAPFICHTNSKESKEQPSKLIVVVEDEKASSLEECDTSRKTKPTLTNGCETENIARADNEEEERYIL